MRCYIELVGRLSAQPDIRDLPNGDKVAILTVVTEETWIDRASSERQTRSTWHTVRVAKLGIVKAIQRQLSIDALVLVVGSLRYSEWTDAQNVRRRTAEVVVKGADHQLIFLTLAADGAP